MDTVLHLLPELGAREAWAVGLVVVLAVLRPVGRVGWVAAGALIVAGVGSMGVVFGPIVSGPVPAGVWPWIAGGGGLALAAVLAVAATTGPLRWEPRTGPSAAMALIAGAAIFHLGAAWHAGGGLDPVSRGLAAVGQRWISGSLAPEHLDPATNGPLTWVLSGLAGSLPVLGPRGGGALLVLVAVALTVFGAERLGRRWGYVGTARCIAAAVAWSPPLLLAHVSAPAAAVATAALVWSWWALLEVWSGRHRPGRLAVASGALLGAAVGLSLWPLLVAPLWLRRLGVRTAGWFAVGFGVSMLATVGALVPTSIGLPDVWRAGVTLDGAVRPATLLAIVAVALLAVAARGRLSPTRLSAMTAVVLLVAIPWWLRDQGHTAGPVAAIPFVLLAAVAPDRPEERWPPDAGRPEDARSEVGV